MSYHEKMWRWNLYVAGCTIGLVILSLILHAPSNITISSFGVIGFAALPLLIYRKKIKEERDEMMREIEIRAKSISLRVVFVLLSFSIIGIFLYQYKSEVIEISSVLLISILWVAFVLLVLIQSLAGLYYLKKGIKSED